MSKSHTRPEAAILAEVDIAQDHNEVLIELRHNQRHRFRVGQHAGGVRAAGRLFAPVRYAGASRRLRCAERRVCRIT
jgi:hypothetical protein